MRFSASHTAKQAGPDHPIPDVLADDREAEKRQRRHRHPVGSAGHFVLGGDHDRYDDAEPQRCHREVVTLQAQNRSTHHEGEERNASRRRSQCEQGRQAVPDRQQRRAIGAHAEKAGVAEADLSGIADQQIQANAHDRVQSDQNRYFVEIVVGERKRQHGDHQRERYQATGARGDARHRAGADGTKRARS
jgi:hypothetical protein